MNNFYKLIENSIRESDMLDNENQIEELSSILYQKIAENFNLSKLEFESGFKLYENTNILIELIRFVMNEITAIDGEFRLEPSSVSSPKRRRKVKMDTLIKTLNHFEIPYRLKDLGLTKLELKLEALKRQI